MAARFRIARQNPGADLQRQNARGNCPQDGGGDTLRFRPWRDTASSAAVALHDIARLDVHQGTHGRKLKGALIGFAPRGRDHSRYHRRDLEAIPGHRPGFRSRRRRGVRRIFCGTCRRGSWAAGRRLRNRHLGACEAAESQLESAGGWLEVPGDYDQLFAQAIGIGRLP